MVIIPLGVVGHFSFFAQMIIIALSWRHYLAKQGMLNWLWSPDYVDNVDYSDWKFDVSDGIIIGTSQMLQT